MRHASLFSGIGGFDLAAAWLKWTNIFQVEIDPFCRKLLEKHFPGVARFSDIKRFYAEQYDGTVDVISAGFPCQPFSVAGRRKGKGDNRYLWPQTIRVIKEVRPRWILLENVAGLFSILEPQAFSEVEVKAAQLFCEDNSRQPDSIIQRLQRRVLGTILTEISTAGYLLPSLEDGTPVVLCIPAAGVGAPHRRDRIWIVAHTCDQPKRQKTCAGTEKAGFRERLDVWPQPGTVGDSGSATYTESCDDRRNGEGLGKSSREDTERKSGQDTNGRPPVDPATRYAAHADDRGQYDAKVRPGSMEGNGHYQARQNPAIQPAGCSSPDGNITGTNADGQRLERGAADPNAFSERKGREQHPARFFECIDWRDWPTQSPFCSRDDGIPGELDGISFSKWRKESLRGFGNAIVPQVALQIFKAIEAADIHFADAERMNL